MKIKSFKSSYLQFLSVTFAPFAAKLPSQPRYVDHDFHHHALFPRGSVSPSGLFLREINMASGHWALPSFRTAYFFYATLPRLSGFIKIPWPSPYGPPSRSTHKFRRPCNETSNVTNRMGPPGKWEANQMYNPGGIHHFRFDRQRLRSTNHPRKTL